MLSPTNVENNFSAFDALEHLNCIRMRQVVTDMSVNCQDFISSLKLSALDRLSIRHDALDENSQSTSWTIGTADNCESKLLLSWAFLEWNRVECAVRCGLCSSRQCAEIDRWRHDWWIFHWCHILIMVSSCWWQRVKVVQLFTWLRRLPFQFIIIAHIFQFTDGTRSNLSAFFFLIDLN